MSHDPQTGNIKSASNEQPILGYSPAGDIFPPGTSLVDGHPARQRHFSVLRPELWRPANTFGQVPAGAFTEKDIVALPYEFPPGPHAASADLARNILADFQAGNFTQNTV